MRPLLSLPVLLAGLSVLGAQNLRIIQMEGTYDLDGDGWHEFVALERGVVEGRTLAAVRYYEIDSEGYQRLHWELESPDGLLANFVGVELGDLDGDGNPELITIMNLAEPETEEILQPIAFYYPWEGDGFSETPGGSLNLAQGRMFLRCHNFDLLDFDGDMDQEVVISLGSPVRGLVIADLGGETGDQLVEVAQLRLDGMESGISFVYVAAVDWDRDGFDDLIGFSPEGNVLKGQPFYNLGDGFRAGEPVQVTIPGLDGLIPGSIRKSDWDGDGFSDVLLPFQNGDILALTLSAAGLDVDPLPLEVGPLSDLNTADFNQDGYRDLLLVAGEMNLLTLAYGTAGGLLEAVGYFSLDEEETQVFRTLPIIAQGVYTGAVIAAGWDGVQASLFISDLGLPPAGPPPYPPLEADQALEEQEKVLDVFPEIEAEAITEVEFPAVPKPIPTMGQPLPAGILPRHVLTINQTFAYTLPEEEAEQFYSFRWLQPPPQGMFFHYDSRSIRWIPDGNQLGAYKLAYHVERKIGEMVNLETLEGDTLITYKVIPRLEGTDQRLWIYVNDPPQFLTAPTGTEFVATTEFVYTPVVQDRNPEARLRYTLEVAPEGMVLEDEGTIRWSTDSTHVDVYDVRLVISDGFDRAVQEFQLFARAGVRILSQAALEAQVDQPYRYQVEIWRPNLEYLLQYQLIQAPEGMTLSTAGLVEWTPAVTQVDTQRYTVVVSHGVATDTQRVAVYLNHPPVVEEAPAPMNVVKVGEDYDFQIIVNDPNLKDQLVFTALEMPEGMRMDPYTARLHWEPSLTNVDFSHLKIEVSDGRESRFIESDFFVNAPLQIISIPPMLAIVGEPYEYRIMTTDLNRGSLLPFERILPIADISAVRIYAVNISDDVYRENIQRYIGDWESAPAVYLSQEDTTTVSRLNLKKYVHSIFYEDDRLYVITQTIDERTVAIKDVLWEFFQGSKGKPPRVVVEKLSPIRYSLEEFPDGMEVDEFSGTLKWTPGVEQYDHHSVKLVVSDGYTRDEQNFEIYVNHPATIVSTAPGAGLVGEVYKYQVQVEDKNADADLQYTLLKAPQGMQMSTTGKVVWIPKAAQINHNSFEVRISDGYYEEVQANRVFININPAVISTPKPVALTGHLYQYQVVAEDLNNDQVAFRAIVLPKYATFNRRSGLLRWKPKSNQLGPNAVIITAIDERGATTAHEFQIHVFEDPSARHMINTGWPLLVTFVGVMFAWGVSQM